MEVPEDLARALADVPGATAAFDGLSYTRRRECVGWIGGAKRDATRRDRIAKTIENLRVDGADRRKSC